MEFVPKKYHFRQIFWLLDGILVKFCPKIDEVRIFKKFFFQNFLKVQTRSKLLLTKQNTLFSMVLFSEPYLSAIKMCIFSTFRRPKTVISKNFFLKIFCFLFYIGRTQKVPEYKMRAVNRKARPVFCDLPIYLSNFYLI